MRTNMVPYLVEIVRRQNARICYGLRHGLTGDVVNLLLDYDQKRIDAVEGYLVSNQHQRTKDKDKWAFETILSLLENIPAKL